VERKMAVIFRGHEGKYFEDFKKKHPNSYYRYKLQPYLKIHLEKEYNAGNGINAWSDASYSYILGGIALFILIIACINFINLTTARSVERAKEVGIRKVVGAVRSQLFGQFIGESIIISTLAFVIAVLMSSSLLPLFNQVAGNEISKSIFSKPSDILGLLFLSLFTGFLAGAYPSLVLSSFRPVVVLKGRFSGGTKGMLLRKGLVVFQFALSILLIIGMIVTYRQLDYIQTKNIGYNRENLLYMPLEGDLSKNYVLFKEEAVQLPGILTISKIRQSPTTIGSHTGDIKWVGKDPSLVASFANTMVGYDFINTMHLQLAEGRDFSKDFGTDTTAFIVNETAVKKMGYQNPVGKPLWWGKHAGTIIGVVKDFHFASLHQSIEPLIMRLDEARPWGTILVRTQAGKTKEAIAGLEKLCKTLNPKFPFTYQFSDKEYDKLYRSEQVVSRLANYFAFLAIFISCLGLFGLAAFTAEQRTREIGVRKVLGASVPGIVSMLSKDFLKLVLLAIIIASPVAWYFMHQWLQDYEYRVNIGWWVFAVAGIAAMLIALMTVSFQAIRAAIANPVKSLRTE